MLTPPNSGGDALQVDSDDDTIFSCQAVILFVFSLVNASWTFSSCIPWLLDLGALILLVFSPESAS
jgi:hypothetical protein